MNKDTAHVQIVQERDLDKSKVEALIDRSFGPGRYAKSAERLREGNQPVAELCLVALEGDVLRAAVRFWPIVIGGERGLLLGPLAVDPEHRGRGYGRACMDQALERASELGYGLVILVGDLPYYQRSGFVRANGKQVHFPGPVDPNRLLIKELVAGTAANARGEVRRAI